MFGNDEKENKEGESSQPEKVESKEEEVSVEPEPEEAQEEIKAPNMKGEIKCVKLIDNPIQIGYTTITDKQFTVNASALSKQSKAFTAKFKRMFELGMIREA